MPEPIELDKAYAPKQFEERWYQYWIEEGYFTPRLDAETPAFSIVIPPPNVTGRLHLGHALVNTLQDVLVRWKRMSGFNTLWIPGTDHAGIATQMVVERELQREGTSRQELGREEFVRRVWDWKETHGRAIFEQLERLGVSCDWTRERFTLDEHLSRAVRHVFVVLYEEGLIDRDLAMVNWCPRCDTAISDIEVEYRETEGQLYHIDYPLADGSAVLTVATTRPETMLGDTGVAVHPDDSRTRHLIGRQIELPLTGRRIPIVGDAILVDPEFGTGVVKVTPAHDRNDYEAGLRHDLPQLKVIDEHGRMAEAAGSPFAGMDRFEARKAVVEALREEGFLRKVEPHVHSVGYCGKCDTIAEPMISRQWFVRIAPLAAPAIEVVRDHSVELVPDSWESTYFNWMENIHDWCISRQLWWGHRIPAFYCTCGEIVVTESESPNCPKCGASDLVQDPDVLDTWFSSALWPFSTMGWPEKTRDYETFYPTDVLVTGFDILFFWVARMIMMGLRFTGEPPFKQVYLHGLVRDERGQKMSKSRGNVIDPLEVIDEFGADAVRFTLAILSTGRDIPLAKSRMQGYSAFANKIWNAARFALMHFGDELKRTEPLRHERLSTLDRWILSRLNATTREVNRYLSLFRFDEAANQIYRFVWHEFCDWYIEMIKPVLTGREGDETARRHSRRVLLEVLDRSLRLLHPFMPFITEEIWQKLGRDEPSIMVSRYPIETEEYSDEGAEQSVGTIQQIVTSVRNLRAERGLTPGDRPRLWIRASDRRMEEFLRLHTSLLAELARLSEVELDQGIPPGVHRDRVGGTEIGVEFPEKAMPAEQVAKMQKQMDQLSREIENIRARLQDPKFLERAPAQVVHETRRREDEYRARLEALKQNLSSSVS